ncbi:hypothetical protein PR048_028984 [Dryococelus australis]|uniref:Uncharacterized protein n=1 Tax=Dryococelus australis TaxID=614101 RepID=A0ABQ9GCI7_9NEOP|nr:hypothetical protein PR048_028984 [Dryococelus australis]
MRHGEFLIVCTDWKNCIDTALMLEIWTDMLERFQKVSESCQSVQMSIKKVNRLYDSLVQYMETLREIFDDYEKKVSERCKYGYETSIKRLKKRKLHLDQDRGEWERRLILQGENDFEWKLFFCVVASTFSVFAILSSSSPSKISERAALKRCIKMIWNHLLPTSVFIFQT